jgi:hypothetical protein
METYQDLDLDFKFESGSDKPEKFQIRIQRTAIQTSIHKQRKKTKRLPSNELEPGLEYTIAS